MAVSIFKHDKELGKPVPGYDVVGYHDVTYAGAVLATGEINGYDDSDFTATVWDEDSGTVKTIVYASTRGWTYLNGASVDATPEVRLKAAAYYAKVNLASRLNAAAAAASTPAVGKLVKVVKGRKVAKGTEGTVIWVGEGKYYGPVPRYRSTAWSTKGALRIGLKDAEGTVHWTAASNVEVLNPEDYIADYDELVAAAAASGRSLAGVAA
jgi:hypothetical protein